ncbi:MAG: hypothetical protein N3F09_10710 [Bacteroidia bacterium]|nr:hypothetical protein [Bacteroidia bacterium]
MRTLGYFSLFLFLLIRFHCQIHYWGGGFSLGSNPYHFTGGDVMAHSVFRMKNFASCSFFLSARHDINARWAIMGSLELRNAGFEYILTPQEYSLLNYKQHQSVRQEIVILQASFMGMYKTNLDCKNKRWFFGFGIVPAVSGGATLRYSAESVSSGGAGYYEFDACFNPFWFCFGKWMMGREKIFKNGHLFQWGLEHLFLEQNVGTTLVKYTISGNTYTHVFNNYGKYTGLFFRYMFNVRSSKLSAPHAKNN